MLWWLWILLGLGLLSFELLTPGGFFALFFGLAALLVGALTGLEIGGPPWVQWLLFSGLSVGFVLLLRRPLRERIKPAARALPPIDSLIGEVATLLEDLPPGAVGRAELRGSGWTVRSAEGKTLAKGARCRVERVDGLTLWIRPETTQEWGR
ncbi:MAG TPA: NfeD family protein [Myxococcaceae bacterium]|nr:NfeD family protein [Myxococcaceae bacterium]